MLFKYFGGGEVKFTPLATPATPDSEETPPNETNLPEQSTPPLNEATGPSEKATPSSDETTPPLENATPTMVIEELEKPTCNVANAMVSHYKITINYVRIYVYSNFG